MRSAEPAGGKFCSECGVALGVAGPLGSEERKVVSVLFADLVGFTSRAERLDPEDAVGDRAATAWWGRPPWRAIHEQLCRIRREAEGAHIELATSAVQVWKAFESGHVSVILGLEGGDGIGRELSRLDKLHKWGIRLLVPVHLRDNHIGTTRLPWRSYMRIPGFPRRRSRGLTEFGHAVIERRNSLGMIIDVSHSDTTTALDTAKHARRPIIASHAGGA